VESEVDVSSNFSLKCRFMKITVYFDCKAEALITPLSTNADKIRISLYYNRAKTKP